MSYLVLARKYRPRGFDGLVGQEHVVQALSNAPRSSGCTTPTSSPARAASARRPSRASSPRPELHRAGRPGGITAQPCGRCAGCTDIDDGRFVDYVELDAASNRGVEEITQLLDQSVYKPVVGRFKVYMIDEVHMLTTHAFNAMLKTLEEPPEYLKFVLATTDPQKIPPDRPLALPALQPASDGAGHGAGHLQGVLAAEKIEPTRARCACSRARRTARCATRCRSPTRPSPTVPGAWTRPGVREMLGAVDRSHALSLVEAMARRDGAALVAGVDAARARCLPARRSRRWRAAAADGRRAGVPETLDAQDPQTPETLRVAAARARRDPARLQHRAPRRRSELGLAPDEYGGLVMVLLRWLAFPAGRRRRSPDTHCGSIDPRHRRRGNGATGAAPAAGEIGIPSRPSVEGIALVAPRRVEAPARRPAATDAALGDRWESHVRRLIQQGSISAMARELALQAQCVAVDGTAWQLRVERESLCAPAQRERLQAALRQHLGEAGPLASRSAPPTTRRRGARRPRA